MSDDALLLAEIARDARRRDLGVWLCLGMALLLAVGVFYSTRMMHGPGPWHASDGTIVAVWRDESGELQMTSEFTDAEGAKHRETESEGYHYKPGDPEVGQTIEYFSKRSERTGDLQAFPRADRILQWVFGVPMAFMLVMGAGSLWLDLRKSAYRRRLLREGRREPGQMHAIAHRTISIPVGAAANTPIVQWRLEARYFEPTAGGFVDCHSDWIPAPAPELQPDTPLPPIFVDPANPKRYWLPVGALAVPGQQD